MQPSCEGVARWPWRVVVPTKMAKASCLEIEREARRIASENEKTMPTLAKVRSIPEEIPKSWGGTPSSPRSCWRGRTRWPRGR